MSKKVGILNSRSRGRTFGDEQGTKVLLIIQFPSFQLCPEMQPLTAYLTHASVSHLLVGSFGHRPLNAIFEVIS